MEITGGEGKIVRTTIKDNDSPFQQSGNGFRAKASTTVYLVAVTMSDNIIFEGSSHSLIRINTDKTSDITGTITNGPTPQTCDQVSNTICTDFGYPGEDCTAANDASIEGVICIGNITYPFINSIVSPDCENSNGNQYHLDGCPASGFLPITINGLYFTQNTGSISESVQIGNVFCSIVAWTSNQINCTLPNVGGLNLVVNVMAIYM